MPEEAYNKVDIVSWLINVRHDWEPETEDHWDNPSQYPIMRQILHESVHFWQAVGTPYFSEVSFDAFKDYLRIRSTAYEKSKNDPIPVDLLELEPNRLYFLYYQKIMHRYGELSGADIIEGLARYWDIHLCGVRHMLEGLDKKEVDDAQLKYGPFFLPDQLHYTDTAFRYVFEEVEARYNKAYKFALDNIGREAFILFPILGFLSLSTSHSVSNFQKFVKLYAETKPLKIPRGNFLQVWDKIYDDAFKWIKDDLNEPIYSSLTVYNRSRKKLAGWSINSPLVKKLGIIIGHGALDPYIRQYWQFMKFKNPAVPKEDLELHINTGFCLPGNPDYRINLYRGFHPPVILFADGKSWIDQTNWGDRTAGLENELISFGGTMGAAMALSGEFDTNVLKVKCPHISCEWHNTRLCWKVIRFPDQPGNCIMPNLYKTMMYIDLPQDKDWDVGQIERPIQDNREHFLSTEFGF